MRRTSWSRTEIEFRTSCPTQTREAVFPEVEAVTTVPILAVAGLLVDVTFGALTVAAKDKACFKDGANNFFAISVVFSGAPIWCSLNSVLLVCLNHKQLL